MNISGTGRNGDKPIGRVVSCRNAMAGSAYTVFKRSCSFDDPPMCSWSIDYDAEKLDVVSIRYREIAMAVAAAGITMTAWGCRAALLDECL